MRDTDESRVCTVTVTGEGTQACFLGGGDRMCCWREGMRVVDAETDLLPLHRGTRGRWQLGEHTWPDLGAMSENEQCSTSLVRWVSGRHKGGGGHSCATA